MPGPSYPAARAVAPTIEAHFRRHAEDAQRRGVAGVPGVADALTIERLIDVLSQRVGRRVVDKTNLTGPFDLDLQWTPDQIPGSDRGLPPPPIDPNGPALFTALQEQLGLKLDSQRGPVDMLVIDEVSKPSAD